MKILQLTVENFKKIKAFILKPDPYVQEISGANGAGKSSALDAIWAALGGAEMVKASGTSQPIRNGEKKAMVTLDLGDMIVTRRWTASLRADTACSSVPGPPWCPSPAEAMRPAGPWTRRCPRSPS